MDNKTITERELVIPALKVILQNGGKITTTDLISKLVEIMKPGAEDMQILFGRNDTRFSQKVRNLISHKTICPIYADYDSKSHSLTINESGIKLIESYNTSVGIQEHIFNNEEGSFFDGQDSLEEDEEYNFLDKKYVSVENLNYSVYELKRKYDKTQQDLLSGVEPKNGLILDESFQRTGNVWSKKQQCQLIESILMDIPLPFIYLAESSGGNLVVVDGRQRLTALFQFLDNKFTLNNLTYFPELNGMNAKKLKDENELYKTKIEDAHLFVIKIKETTPSSLKLQIFSRVNRNGTPLNSQEIRHALYQGASTKLLERLSYEFEFLKRTRMKDRYLILRYISIRLFYLKKLINYNTGVHVQYKNINDFLEKSMKAINTFSEEQIDEIYNDYCNTYIKAIDLLGENAFRLEEKAPINMIYYELTLLILSLKPGISTSEELNRCLNILKNSGDIKENGEETPFYKNIKYHRDSAENVKERLFWLKEFVEG